MKTAVFVLMIILLICVAGLAVWRQMDHRADQKEMDRLSESQPKNPIFFEASMIADMPEPARRYFAFAIKEGTPLYTVAEIKMLGKFGMGEKSDPKYLPMTAMQVLAAPHGFVWKMSGGSGLQKISGSDSGKWTRFWLGGLLPVARAGGTEDHQRSAFGRYVAEAVFWTPAALLPGPGIEWQAISKNEARVTVTHEGNEQMVEITVDEDGKPIEVSFQRWSNANDEGQFKLQPFGGYLSEFREFEGFILPTHVEAGNHFGTDKYFPFFIADIIDIQFK